MTEHWDRLLTAWSGAGLIDAETAGRIREFERSRAGSARWRWPMWLALAAGGLLVGSGVLLFIAAHWDMLSPGSRFAIVLATVGLFHAAGAAVSGRAPALGWTMHAVGTASLGGGVFLAGQIFNLAEHWPGGFMLWALGASVGYALLRQWTQLLFVAVLVPVWLGGEWVVAVENSSSFEYVAARVLTAGAFLTALTYFTATTGPHAGPDRRAVYWLGAVALLPTALALAASSSRLLFGPTVDTPSAILVAIGWTAALGLPLLLAVALRRVEAWPNVVAAGWVIGLFVLRSMAPSDIPLFAWWAIGAAGLVAWGVRDGRVDRINLGAIVFAATVLVFYFSQVMTTLGRSASLIGLGILFLAGGWALERGRRHLVRQSKGESS